MEKKTRHWIILASLLLAAAAGAAIGLATAGHAEPLSESSLNDREIKELERRAEAGSGRIEEEVRGAREQAEKLTARERDAIEGYRELERNARKIADGLGGIGTDAAGARECLDELADLVAELQRRSQEQEP